MPTEIYVECGDWEFGIQPTDYTPGTPAVTWGPPDNWDPGDGPEVSFPQFVTVYVNGVKVASVPWDVMVLYVAADTGVDLHTAETSIETRVYSQLSDSWERDADDDWRYCDD